MTLSLIEISSHNEKRRTFFIIYTCEVKKSIQRGCIEVFDDVNYTELERTNECTIHVDLTDNTEAFV